MVKSRQQKMNFYSFNLNNKKGKIMEITKNKRSNGRGTKSLSKSPFNSIVFGKEIIMKKIKRSNGRGTKSLSKSPFNSIVFGKEIIMKKIKRSNGRGTKSLSKSLFNSIVFGKEIIMKKIKMKKRFGLNRQKSRGIVDNVLSGIKAGFKSILNFEHAIERKKMENQKSKSTFSAILPALILGLIVLWTGLAAVAAEKKYVTDPTTGKVVTAPEYGGTLNFLPHHGATQVVSDPYFGWSSPKIGSVVQKLGIGNWGIDRDEWDFKSGFLPVSAMTGRLAESWEMPDDKTIVVKVRQGVRWHDKAPMNGRLLTAQDVEYTFHRMLGMGDFTDAGPTPFGGVAALKSIPFESITATDKYTVVFKLKEPYLPALGLILIDNFVFIMPPEVIEQHGDVQDWRNLVGTGPWMLTDVVEDSSMTYTKNPDYWGYDEKYPQNRLPYVDELRSLIMVEQATKIAALRSGKIDFNSLPVSIDQAESLQRTNPEIVLHEMLNRSNDAFATNVSKPPFDDIRVRKAMQMALDLETINNTFYKGYAVTTPQGMVGVKGYYIPFEEWPEEVKKGYRYDPEGAEELLDEAGYTRGADGTRFKTRLKVLGSASYAEIAAAYWAEIGVDVEIDVFVDWARFHEGLFSRTYEGIHGSIAGHTDNPVTMIGWHRSDHQWNRPLAEWPELDAMVDAALAATTIEEQKRLIREADMYAIEKHWNMWGPKSPKFNVFQPWVIGYNGEFPTVGLGPNEYNVITSRLWIDSELKEAMGY